MQRINDGSHLPLCAVVPYLITKVCSVPRFYFPVVCEVGFNLRTTLQWFWVFPFLLLMCLICDSSEMFCVFSLQCGLQR